MAAGGAVNTRLQAQGWGLVGLAEGLAALGLAVGAGAPPVVAMMPVSWARMLGGGVAPPFLSAFGARSPAAAAIDPAAAAPLAVAAPLAAAVPLETVLALAARTAGGAVDADAPLLEAGLDSLGAVELRNQLQQALGKGAPALPSTLVFDHPTARQLAAFLETQALTSSMEPAVVRSAVLIPQMSPLAARFIEAIGRVNATPLDALLSVWDEQQDSLLEEKVSTLVCTFFTLTSCFSAFLGHLHRMRIACAPQHCLR